MENFFYPMRAACLHLIFYLLFSGSLFAQMSYTYVLDISADSQEEATFIKGVRKSSGKQAKPSDHLFDYAGAFSTDAGTAAANADLKTSRLCMVTTSDYNSMSAESIIDEWAMEGKDAFVAIHFQKQQSGDYKAYFTIKLGAGLAEKFTGEITDAIWNEVVKPALSQGRLKKVSEDLAEIFRTEESALFCIECWIARHKRAAEVFLEFLRPHDFRALIQLNSLGPYPSELLHTIHAKLKIGEYEFHIKKEFHPEGDFAEYAEFLHQAGIEYFKAKIIQYEGMECCKLLSSRLDATWQRSPPLFATLSADVLMGAPGAFYGWFTGRHWRSGEELSTFEQVIAVLDLVPGEALVKIGVVAVVGATGVMIVKDYKFIISHSAKLISSIDEVRHLLKTEKNTAFFWSGKSNGVGGMEKAKEIAQSKGGVTLEKLIERNNVKLPEYNPSDPVSKKLWEDVSEEYARQASGEIRAVIGKDLRVGNIWEKEFEILKNNKNVTRIITIDPETLIETIIFIR